MNSVVLLCFGIAFLVFGYHFYSRKIAALFEINPQRTTPAIEKYDAVDYVPAKNWFVLFGHHFSSISGAGPIIGPVIGCLFWGWMPSFIWIVVGSIFIGGVHDFVSLIISVREGGSSIADVSSSVVSRKAKLLFCIFVWLALILVVAVFVDLCARTFVAEPKIIVPSLGLIPIALLFGFLVYIKKRSFFSTTALGLIGLVLLIIIGQRFDFSFLQGSLLIWTVLLLIYAFIASVIPVNILLQPRDYLCSFLMIFGIACGLIGIFVSRPTVHLPAYIAWNTGSGFLWPMLFVTIACGSISGFHSVVASGTTSKQLPNERYARRIGYGGMLLEGVLALIAILAVVSGISGNRSEIISLFKSSGPVSVFGRGFGGLTGSLLGSFGVPFAILMLNAFILTTLDTATRICRYITEELTGIKNRILSSLIVVIFSGFLALSGAWNKIWPVFGASNQLVASLALFVASCWLLSKKKTTIYTLLGAIFMFLTTVAALILQMLNFLKEGNLILTIVSLSLMLLSIVMLIEVVKVFGKNRKEALLCN